MTNEESENVFVDAHAWLTASGADALNVPPVDADRRLMWLIVSEVPPFVHGPAVPVIAFDPPDAAAIVAAFRVVSPAAAAVAPAAPGSAVWSWTNVVPNVASRNELTGPAASPVVTTVLLG
jgi:hypothetical protein